MVCIGGGEGDDGFAEVDLARNFRSGVGGVGRRNDYAKR